MGTRVWTFLRSREGELRPVSQRAVDEFFARTGTLPADADGFVRFAEVVVDVVERCAVEVLRVGFHQHKALKNGKLDRKYFKAVVDAAPDLIAWLGIVKPPPGVVDASHRFEKRRLEHLNTWTPTEVELEMLRYLVNGKAGRVIM